MHSFSENEDKIRSLPLPAKEYLESIEDLIFFLKKSRKRKLEDKQLIMILKRRLAQIKTSSNTLATKIGTDIEVLLKTYSYSVSLFSKLLHLIPDKQEYEDIWLELMAMENIAISVFASLILMASDHLRFFAQASLLSQMLLGVENISNLPELPSPESPEFMEKFGVIFNLLNSNVAMYTISLKVIPTIHETDFIEWVNNGFWNSKLLLELIEKINIKALYYTTVKFSPETFYLRITSIISPVLQLYSLPLLVERKIGSKWPEEINTYDLMDENNIHGLLKYGEKLTNYINNIEQKLYDLYKKKVIDVNMNPSKNDLFKMMTFLIKNNLENHISTMNTINSFFEINKEHSPSTIQEIEEQIEKTNKFIQEIMKLQAQTSENNIRSITGQLMIEKLELLTILHILLSISKNQPTIFDKYYQAQYSLVSQIPPNTAPDLHLYMLLGNIFVSTKFKQELDKKLVLNQIEKIINYYVIYPRHYVALLVLKAIIMFLDGETDQESIKKLLIEGEQVIINTGNDHIKDLYSQYVSSLLSAFNEEMGAYEIGFENIDINPLDPYTWLIPDFTITLSPKVTGAILYLPFNIEKYSLIPRSFT